MILYHVEPFDEFALALREALRSGGRAFFYENSARNPLLMLLCRCVVGEL
jgi:hypothetical protein